LSRVGAGEEREEIDDVVLGVVLDLELLVRERAVQRVAKELLQIADGNHLACGMIDAHCCLAGVRLP
jgi:hypothetical protein